MEQNELQKLSLLVKKHGKQWDVLKAEFPDRTASNIQLQYETTNTKAWSLTTEEKEILYKKFENIKKDEDIDWVAIQKSLPLEKQMHIIKRYYYKTFDTINFERWSLEDMEKLQNLIENFGEKQWKLVALKMGNRSADQCKNKWMYEKRIRKQEQSYTEIEDKQIMEYVDLFGESFEKIKREMKSTKSVLQLKNRYLQIKRRLQAQGNDLSDQERKK
ncbi:unnamed protein product [Rhizopus stolonifer]